MSDPNPPLDRETKRRLAVIRHVEEVSGNVAMSCRYFGISRQAYYVWYRRYQADGVSGLRARSRRPNTSLRATHVEIVGKIIYLRQNYHFGPAKIAMYLRRYHDVTVSHSGVWRILKRLDLNRLPSSQRYKRHDKRWTRYEKQLPGHRVQIDVKFIEPIAGAETRRGGRRKFYQFTAIDDCTRLRVLRIYPTLNQKTAIEFVDYVIRRLPFQVEVIQTDNGAEFQSAFHYHVLDKGIGHVYIKPRTPRLNGKVERSHRIDAEEFYQLLDGVVIDDAEVFNNKLQEWENYYNYDRPHGGLGGQTPYERLKQKTAALPDKTTSTKKTKKVFDLAGQVPARFRALILLAAFTSLRYGELAALRRRDFDSRRGTLTVRATLVERQDGELIVGQPRRRQGCEPSPSRPPSAATCAATSETSSVTSPTR